MKSQWMVHFNELHQPQVSHARICDLLLQIILTRMMHAVIVQLRSNEATYCEVSVAPSPHLTSRERNAVR